MTLPLPLDSLHNLAVTLGNMPPGDIPACWFVSLDDQVLKDWDRYSDDYRTWRQLWDQLLEVAGLPADTKRVSVLHNTLKGLLPPAGVKPPSGWRKTSEGYFVPRKRSRAEKASRANEVFAQLTHIPRAVDYMTGMPDAVWANGTAYPVQIRKPAKAVCAFLGVDPDAADVPFVVDGRWSRLKISTYLMLRERQQAGG